MKKLITGFKTIQDVKDTLKWIQENTSFKWIDGDEPTSQEGFEMVEEKFERYNPFVLEYNDDFVLHEISDYGKEVELINFKDLMYEFKEGELVEVSDSILDQYEKRIYLFEYKKAFRKYATATEYEYKNQDSFSPEYWKYIRKIKQPITHTVTLSDGTTVTLNEEDIKNISNQ